MKIQKIVLSSFLITLLVGCEKKPVVENKISEESTTVVQAHIPNDITSEELEKLRVISKDVSKSPDTTELAEKYLENINGYAVEEVRDFITEYYDANQAPEDEVSESDVRMEYRVDVDSTVVNSQIVTTYYLDILSLSDHVEVDRVEVNRGNCPIQYSSGENPLGYGQSVRYILNCDPHNVREVKVYLQDGRELLMSPK
ncbi:hypothetical protein ACK1JC_14000 [Acinetobacter sp. TY2]|uniref:hypothetical protein n=1 Tax=Acinetobacter sp. TY2 TaxID=3387403 RepID=UPI0039177850